jgi:serine/threonine-protein kinase
MPGPGDVIAGKLQVIRRLGEGGMGAVYEVEHTITRHRRALKLLHAQYAQNPGVLARFLREASAAGRIGNEHIAETFDAGTLESGEPYLVMELLQGEPLSGVLQRRGGRLPLGELVDLVGQACEGIGAAHRKGIIHRDIKPDNLFVIERDGRPFVKVLDFGISKFDASLLGENGQPITREGTMLGTPYYMSPEQFRGEAGVDERADVYSLGVLLYECAAGVRPFDGATLPELMLRIAEGNPPSLAQLRPDLPPDFVQLVHRAFASDRARRPASVEELRLELLRASQGASPSGTVPAASGLASPVVGPSSAKPAPSRHRLLLGVVGAAALGAVALGAGRLVGSKDTPSREAPRRAEPPPEVVVVHEPPGPSAVPSASGSQVVPVASVAPTVAPVRSAVPVATGAGKATRAQQSGLGQNPY